MTKIQRAKNILIELEALKTTDPAHLENNLALINEALRDAKALAEEVAAQDPQLELSAA